MNKVEIMHDDELCSNRTRWCTADVLFYSILPVCTLPNMTTSPCTHTPTTSRMTSRKILKKTTTHSERACRLMRTWNLLIQSNFLIASAAAAEWYENLLFLFFVVSVCSGSGQTVSVTPMKRLITVQRENFIFSQQRTLFTLSLLMGVYLPKWKRWASSSSSFTLFRVLMRVHKKEQQKLVCSRLLFLGGDGELICVAW